MCAHMCAYTHAHAHAHRHTLLRKIKYTFEYLCVELRGEGRSDIKINMYSYGVLKNMKLGIISKGKITVSK